MPPNDPAPESSSNRYSGLKLTYDTRDKSSGKFDIAVERPVNILYGSIPFAVMMTSPADLQDFAYGFSFTEGIIDQASDIRGVAISSSDDGISVDISLKAENMQRHLGRGRAIAGRTGCGVCGITDLAQLPAAGRVDADVQFDLETIAKALQSAPALQGLNQQTHAVHGAAFCQADGAILELREDVGRHNALDKLIGSILRKDMDREPGFILITSRASYEMVEKTARLGVAVLVAISAPTSMAIERAKAYGMSLIAIARDDGAVLFCGPERIKQLGVQVNNR